MRISRNSPCGLPESTPSWRCTASALKSPLRTAQNCAHPGGVRRWPSWRRGRCSSPAPPSCCSCDGGRGLSAPRGAPRVSWEGTVGGDGGCRAGGSDRTRWRVRLAPPGPERVCTQSSGNTPPQVRGGPGCHVGRSWGSSSCEVWGGEKTCSLLHRPRWSTGSCVLEKTWWAAVSKVSWGKDDLGGGPGDGRSEVSANDS